MNPIPITARQMNAFDALDATVRAADATLKVALTHHANTLGQVNKTKAELWKELAELHRLDIDSVAYQLKHIGGTVFIVECETGESE
jgi:hypothetical protein